jgi:hypothetical protein
MIAIISGLWWQLNEIKKQMNTEDGKLWIDLSSFRETYARNRLEDERRYVNRDNLAEFKEEIRDAMSDMKKSVDKLADKLETPSRFGGNKTG